MKSAYELAMERLNKTSRPVKLSNEKKRQLAELDSQYAAKIAEREIAARGELDQAATQGDAAHWQEIEQQLVNKRKQLQAELEEKKEKVRQARD
jgi:hypothetical protein